MTRLRGAGPKSGEFFYRDRLRALNFRRQLFLKLNWPCIVFTGESFGSTFPCASKIENEAIMLSRLLPSRFA